MITKMTLSPLDTFQTIAPSQGRGQSDYAISIGKKRIYLNQACYKHFKGHKYFKFMIHSHYLAVVATDKDDDDAVLVKPRTRSYHALFNTGIHYRIFKRLAVKPIDHVVRIKVDGEDDKFVSPKYLIFDMQND